MQVWDREIILTAMKDFYENDMDLLQEAIEGNITDVRTNLLSMDTGFQIRMFKIDFAN